MASPISPKFHSQAFNTVAQMHSRLPISRKSKVLVKLKEVDDDVTMVR